MQTLITSQHGIFIDFGEHVSFIHFLDALQRAQNETSVTVLNACFSAFIFNTFTGWVERLVHNRRKDSRNSKLHRLVLLCGSLS